MFFIIAQGGPYSFTARARFCQTLKTNEHGVVTSHAKAKSHWPHNFSLPHDISVTNRTGRSETESTGAMRSGPRINPLSIG